MKKLFFAIAVGVFTTSANAQDTSDNVKGTQITPTPGTDTYTKPDRNISGNKTFIWSIGVEPTLPMGHFNDLSGFGLGGSLQGEYKPGKIGITVNAGYIDYFGKTVNGLKYSDFSYWPVMGGLKFYISDHYYIHGQAGAGFGDNGLGTSFWYGGGIGINLSKSVDAELKYTGWKQKQTVANTNNGYNTGTVGNEVPANTTTYGGHYPTIGLRLAYNF
jgi:hypothetical protein